MSYKPLSDEELLAWKEYIEEDNPISEMLSVVEQARRANSLAASAKEFLHDFLYNKTCVPGALQRAIAAYRGEEECSQP